MKPSKFLNKVVNLTEKFLLKNDISDDNIINWEIDYNNHPILSIECADGTEYIIDIESARIKQIEQDISVKDVFRSDIRPALSQYVLAHQLNQPEIQNEFDSSEISMNEPGNEEINYYDYSNIIPELIPADQVDNIDTDMDTILVHIYSPDLDSTIFFYNTKEYKYITMENLFELNISPLEFLRNVKNDMRTREYSLKLITDLIKEISDSTDSIHGFSNLENNYVLKNPGYLLNDTVLNDLTEKLGNEFYIVPCSFQECIICPKNEEKLPFLLNALKDARPFSKNVFEYHHDTKSFIRHPFEELTPERNHTVITDVEL